SAVFQPETSSPQVATQTPRTQASPPWHGAAPQDPPSVSEAASPGGWPASRVTEAASALESGPLQPTATARRRAAHDDRSISFTPFRTPAECRGHAASLL